MQAIGIVRETKNTLRVYVTDALGNPYSLNIGDEIALSVKKPRSESQPIFCVKGTEREPGYYYFDVLSTHTDGVPVGEYLYDVAARVDGELVNVVWPGSFFIVENATELECFG